MKALALIIVAALIAIAGFSAGNKSVSDSQVQNNISANRAALAAIQ